MEHFIGCDAHKKFSIFVAVNEAGRTGHSSRRCRHTRKSIEASGNYNWLDEMEMLGHRPHLANPLEAKRRMGLTNKTDKLDATGLAILLRNGSAGSVDSADGTA
jgi:hypothetical protein